MACLSSAGTKCKMTQSERLTAESTDTARHQLNARSSGSTQTPDGNSVYGHALTEEECLRRGGWSWQNTVADSAGAAHTTEASPSLAATAIASKAASVASTLDLGSVAEPAWMRELY